jgi:hypothetical protein
MNIYLRIMVLHIGNCHIPGGDRPYVVVWKYGTCTIYGIAVFTLSPRIWNQYGDHENSNVLYFFNYSF